MGKKGGSAEKGKAAARAFTLKVAMHCHCDGCIDKIRGAVKNLALHPGVAAMDQSAVESKGEVKLVATADPEKLRHRLHKATGKSVDLVVPKEKKEPAKKEDPLYLPALQYAQQLGGGGYGAAQAYQWPAAPSPYAYPAAAAWGQYAYPAPAQGQGAYYGGAPAWNAHGY